VDEDKKPLLIGLVVAAALGGGAALYFRKPAAPEAPPPAPAPAVPSAAPEAPAEPLPSLAESDAWIRAKLAGLIKSPALAGWLKTDDLVRRAAAAVSLIAAGESPRDSLSFLAPAGKFKAVKKGGMMVADAKSFARYDAVADAVASLDAAGAAKLVDQADPLFQQACSELGAVNCSFKQSLLKAIRHLAATPVPDGDVPLRAKVISYAFVDEHLEKLSKAQKHLLRMGPANERKVLAKLRELGRALGASEL
jgi:hypothetical protein